MNNGISYVSCIWSILQHNNIYNMHLILHTKILHPACMTQYALITRCKSRRRPLHAERRLRNTGRRRPTHHRIFFREVWRYNTSWFDSQFSACFTVVLNLLSTNHKLISWLILSRIYYIDNYARSAYAVTVRRRLTSGGRAGLRPWGTPRQRVMRAFPSLSSAGPGSSLKNVDIDIAVDEFRAFKMVWINSEYDVFCATFLQFVFLRELNASLSL